MTAFVHARTGGEGADVVIDAAAAPSTVDDSLKIIRRHGEIVMIGMFGASVTFRPALLFYSEATVTASSGSFENFPAVAAMMERGEVPLDGWVWTISLDDLVDKGFEALHAGEAMKILVDLNR